MSPRGKGRTSGAAWIRRALIVLGLAYAAAFAWTGHLVGRAETAYWEGRLEVADALLDRATFWMARGGRVDDARGVVALTRGDEDLARTHLESARGSFFHPAAFGTQRLLESFLRDGDYESAAIYARHRLELGEDGLVSYYLAAAELALGRYDEVEKNLAPADNEPGLTQQVASIRQTLRDIKTKGRYEYMSDRRGAAIGVVDPATGKASLLEQGLEGLLQGPWGPGLGKHDVGTRVELTIDLEIQRAAQAALGTRAGSIVVIEPATGALLAAASYPLPDGTEPPASLSRVYEPGSIMKMVTLVTALRTGADLDGLFPMDCPGWIEVDNLAFRDWLTHGDVASIDDAVAVSCNIAFGRVGFLVGRDALDEELTRFGFVAGSGGTERVTDLTYTVGRLHPLDADHPRFALARRAEGLDSIDITPIHAALVAAGLAAGTYPPAPYLLEKKTNILGEKVVQHEPAPPAAASLSPAQVDHVRNTMVSAVTDRHGTARRAAVEDLDLALKTGTSGKNPPGFDAVIIGFAPANEPRVAWALVAEGAGKAQIEGARIIREFVSRIALQLGSRP